MPDEGAAKSPNVYRITVDHRFPLPYEARNPANLDEIARGATWTITTVDKWIDPDGYHQEPDVTFWYLARQRGRWVILNSLALRRY
jgi:hypothetical protein